MQILARNRVSVFRVLLGLAGLAFSAAASAIPYAVGDVFASTGNGLVNVFSQTGVLIQTLNTTKGGFTTGSTFDSFGNFYVTNFSSNTVAKFDNNGVLVNANWATGGGSNESIVFDVAGNAYIGNAGSATIKKVDSNGVQIAVFTTLLGTDWIDLAADQKTLIYSNEGSEIRSLNTSTLADTVFTNSSGANYAKRITTSGDVLMASSTGSAYRFNSAGVLQQTYAVGIGSIFALNLDANGTSFWTGATGGQAIRKVNIATGAIEQSWSTGTGQLFGLAVFGEILAGGGGGGGGGGTQVPEPGTLSLLGAAFIGFVLLRRRKAMVA